MYKISVDRAHAIVAFVLDGLVKMDEMQKFVTELQLATLSVSSGGEIKIKADVRTMRPEIGRAHV